MLAIFLSMYNYEHVIAIKIVEENRGFIEAHVLLYMSSSMVFQSKELQTEPLLQ